MTTPVGVAPVRTDLDARRTRLLLAATTVAMFGFHLWSTGRVGRPTVVFDETGYLGNARWLAGVPVEWEMPTSPTYAVGYPLVISPAMRWFSTAASQWRAVMVLNSAMLAAVLPLAYLVARRVLGATRTHALGAGIVAGVAPAVVAASPSAIAENLALSMLIVTVLAAHRMLQPGPVLARAWFGAAVAFLCAVHPRFLLVFAAAVLVVAVGVWRRLVPAVVAAANAATAAVVGAAAWLLTRAVVDARWEHVERLEGGPGEVLELLTSLGGIREAALVAIGQGWYLAAGSVGLAVLGVVAWVWVIRGGDPGAAPSRLTAVFVVIAAASVFFTSVVFFARTQFRDDHLTYGRHNDSFMPLWLVGAVVIWTYRPRRVVLAGLAVAAASIAVLFTALVLTRDPVTYGGLYSPFAIPSVARYIAEDPGGTWFRATIAALVGCAVLAGLVGLAGLRRRWLALPVLVVWFVVAGLATVERADRFEEIVYERWDVPRLVDRVDADRISIDGTAVDVGFPVLSYGSQLPGVAIETYDPTLGDRPAGSFVLTRFDDAAMRSERARIAFVDRSGLTSFRGAPDGVALWVRPGPEMDRLDRLGLLLPVDFPAPLPSAARSVELDVEGDQVVRVGSGDSASVRVEGRHGGGGSPWPDRFSHLGPARVTITGQVTGVPSGRTGGDGPVVGGELPEWVFPGDTFAADVGVLAVDADGRPLQPGRYRVQLGVGQVEPAWFAPGGDDAFVTVDVTD